MHSRRVILSRALFCGVICAGGCSAKLETGYEPQKLGSLTPAQRRGLYAPDFSPEAQAAQADKKDTGDDYRMRLPGGQE